MTVCGKRFTRFLGQKVFGRTRTMNLSFSVYGAGKSLNKVRDTMAIEACMSFKTVVGWMLQHNGLTMLPTTREVANWPCGRMSCFHSCCPRIQFQPSSLLETQKYAVVTIILPPDLWRAASQASDAVCTSWYAGHIQDPVDGENDFSPCLCWLFPRAQKWNESFVVHKRG